MDLFLCFLFHFIDLDVYLSASSFGHECCLNSRFPCFVLVQALCTSIYMHMCMSSCMYVCACAHMHIHAHRFEHANQLP